MGSIPGPISLLMLVSLVYALIPDSVAALVASLLASRELILASLVVVR
jgi:hypothetical protein